MPNILFVTAECAPFIKAGGLADVASSLPAAVQQKTEDCTVQVVMPYYSGLQTENAEVTSGSIPLSASSSFPVEFDGKNTYVRLFTGERRGVLHYFLQAPDYFDVQRPYGDGTETEVRRFTFFCRAVLEALPTFGVMPDILHLNDWHTGPLAAMVYERRKQDPRFAHLKTLFTIHNLYYQGIAERGLVQRCTALPDEMFEGEGGMAWHDGLANPMKCGLTYADRISTVSERYAEEIQTPELGVGLDGLLSARRDQLCGIVNGIDYRVFDPAVDIYIRRHRYTSYNATACKAQFKQELQEQLHLTQNPDVFLVGVVSRLTEQKGIDLIAEAAERIISKGAQLIITGEGDKSHTELVHSLANRFKGQIGAYPTFDESFSRNVYAASDALLMPSRFEPCGLSQMIAMRYGTIPIVRRTGGLRDTVIPYTSGRGFGFTFEDFTADALYEAFAAAEEMFTERRRSWNSLMMRDMAEDFSWAISAKKYAALYRSLSEE